MTITFNVYQEVGKKWLNLVIAGWREILNSHVFLDLQIWLLMKRICRILVLEL